MMKSKSQPSTLLFRFLLFIGVVCGGSRQDNESKKVYIVYMGEKQHEDPDLVTAIHHDTLSSVLGSKEAALDSLVYSYKHGFSGFAAKITDSQAKLIAQMPGVLRVYPSPKYKLATTRSWDFMDLNLYKPKGLLRESNLGEGVIVGVIDSGIWPESKSFDAKGYGPAPARWKGTCQTGENFTSSHCTNKIIGARFYPKQVPKEVLQTEFVSPRDFNGHGTHCASTILGNPVPNASFNGLAAGLARGGAPRARLAVYKVAWGEGQVEPGTLEAAIDDAIHDGCDMLSMSIGGEEEFSLAALHAAMKGITVVYAGGNEGPRPQTMGHADPWAIVVAASTMDRSFPVPITLGTNETIVGQDLYYVESKPRHHFQRLIYGASCDLESLEESISGAYIICSIGTVEPLHYPNFTHIYEEGGLGVIFSNYPTDLLIKCGIFPCVKVDFEAYQTIVKYVNDGSSPVAKIGLTHTLVGDKIYAPKIASFSSRGPTTLAPELIKPDIAAPGVNILAAVRDSYEFESGTSMAAPHVSGVVALLKASHPNWSPAAIKSAIMTTASTVDTWGVPIHAEGQPRKIADPFDYGAGQINPAKATDPGLVYDINKKDYIEIQRVDSNFNFYSLNLPSISIPNLKDTFMVKRTVTNVGHVNAVYNLVLDSPPGVVMEVHPTTLLFDANIRTHTFNVTFRAKRRVQGAYEFGSLTWDDGGHHLVRIPIAVRTVIAQHFTDSM